MSEYVTLCKLTVNGKSVEDFKQVTEKEIEYYKQINLMNKTGHAKVTPRYGVTVDYVVPSIETEFDWANVANGTLIITDEGGAKTTYSGVYILKLGEKKRDGENEVVRTIDLGAQKKV
jgi:hypothetical protein